MLKTIVMAVALVMVGTVSPAEASKKKPRVNKKHKTKKLSKAALEKLELERIAEQEAKKEAERLAEIERRRARFPQSARKNAKGHEKWQEAVGQYLPAIRGGGPFVSHGPDEGKPYWFLGNAKTARTGEKKTVVFFHGGGQVTRNIISHRNAAALRAEQIDVNYVSMPYHDGLQAFTRFLAQQPDGSVVLAGHSAGGAVVERLIRSTNPAVLAKLHAAYSFDGSALNTRPEGSPVPLLFFSGEHGYSQGAPETAHEEGPRNTVVKHVPHGDHSMRRKLEGITEHTLPKHVEGITDPKPVASKTDPKADDNKRYRVKIDKRWLDYRVGTFNLNRQLAREIGALIADPEAYVVPANRLWTQRRVEELVAIQDELREVGGLYLNMSSPDADLKAFLPKNVRRPKSK